MSILDQDQKYLNDPWHTAIHEAGHAVIGRVLGMVCGHATIIPNEAEWRRDNGGPKQRWASGSTGLPEVGMISPEGPIEHRVKCVGA